MSVDPAHAVDQDLLDERLLDEVGLPQRFGFGGHVFSAMTPTLWHGVPLRTLAERTVTYPSGRVTDRTRSVRVLKDAVNNVSDT